MKDLARGLGFALLGGGFACGLIILAAITIYICSHLLGGIHNGCTV